MLNSVDVVDLDLGVPSGREAGFLHPAVIVTAQRVLDESPAVVHIVPLTTALRPFRSEVEIAPDAGNGLDETSAAQCQHLRAVSVGRVARSRGNVGPQTLHQVRETIALLLDLPG